MTDHPLETASPIKIDIWSDMVCPWCYIGKRNLEAGMAAFSADDDTPPITVEFHSFELSPDTPVDFDGDAADYLHRVRGYPEATVHQMIDRVVGIARNVGLEYDYDSIQHTNTVLAHQLLHHAKAHELQGEMKERLLRAYFIEGRHIGRAEDLADLAAEVGLDREEALLALEQEIYLPAVRLDQAQARAYGISGVPFFVIEGKYGISGAQPPDAFAGALRQVAEERA
jgi:predicted DsbA family dithiol-disulfide isomerase